MTKNKKIVILYFGFLLAGVIFVGGIMGFFALVIVPNRPSVNAAIIYVEELHEIDDNYSEFEKVKVVPTIYSSSPEGTWVQISAREGKNKYIFDVKTVKVDDVWVVEYCKLIKINKNLVEVMN